MQALCDRIGYQFNDPALLKLALTHPSLNSGKSNQRLEFLGDAILGAVIAKLLYDKYPAESEGELARRRAGLVRGETLANIGRDIGIGEALHIGLIEVSADGRDNESNLEDAVEAVIGALYLDGGLEAAASFILRYWSDLAGRMVQPPKDAKTALQEWAQARGLPVPKYTLIETKGLAHAPQFIIEVAVNGYPPQTAIAPSKRAAEQLAAKTLLDVLPV